MPRLISALVLVLFVSLPTQAAFLTTMFTGTNGGAVGGGVYFDLNVTNPTGITLTNIDVNSTIAAGTPITIDIYTRPGTWLGASGSSAGWTLVSSGSGVAAGTDLPSMIDVSDFMLNSGLTGVAIHATNFNHRYTNGNGSNQVFSNADLTFSGGGASNVLFAGTQFNPRVFNGTFTYDVAAPAVPAPASLLAFPAGMALLGLIRRRRSA